MLDTDTGDEWVPACAKRGMSRNRIMSRRVFTFALNLTESCALCYAGWWSEEDVPCCDVGSSVTNGVPVSGNGGAAEARRSFITAVAVTRSARKPDLAYQSGNNSAFRAALRHGWRLFR